MKNEIPNQRSYILRLWVEVLEARRVWRFSLEDTYSGERKGFARLEDVLAYVQKELQEINNE